VLGNATLDAIAAEAPTSLTALGRIKGIGPAKLDRYGADILGIVADHER
jgi:DNA helicase-2/ATP-dependent DNA helicase PcrA